MYRNAEKISTLIRGLALVLATAGAAQAGGTLGFSAGGATYRVPAPSASVIGIVQTGNNLNTTVKQNAFANVVGVVQFGLTPKIAVTQTGTANEAAIIQVTPPASLLGN